MASSPPEDERGPAHSADERAGSGSKRPAPSPRQRWTRRAWWLCAVVAATFALVRLGWPPLRQWLGDFALAQVSSLLEGTLRAERVEALSPWQVRLRGVHIDGPDGQVVIEAAFAEAGVELLPLLHGEIRLNRAWVKDARVSLRGPIDDLVIAHTFMPVPDGTPPDDSPTTITLTIADMRAEQVEVRDLFGELSGSLPEARGEMRFDAEGLRLEAQAPKVRLWRDGANGAVQGELGLSLHMVEGEASTAHVRLEEGASRLEARATTGYVDESFQLGDASLSAHLDDALPARSGFEEYARYLQAPVDVQAALKDGEKLRVDLLTEGGDLSMHGVAHTKGFRLVASTERLDLRPTLGDQVPAPVAGGVSLDLPPAEADGQQPFELHTDRLGVSGWRIPDATLLGALGKRVVEIRALHVPAWTRGGGSLALKGRVSEDLNVHFDVDAKLRHPLLAGLLQQHTGVSGDALDLAANGEYLHEAGRVDARGHFEVSGLKVSGVQVAKVRALVVAKGPVLRPLLDIELSGEDVALPRGHVETFAARVRGFGKYEVALSAHGERSSLDGTLNVELARKSVLLQGKLTGKGPRGGTILLHLGEVRASQGRVVMRGLRLQSGDRVLQVDGEYHPRRSSDLRIAAGGFDLALLSRLPLTEQWFAPYGLEGVYSGNIRLRGTLSQPEVDASLQGQSTKVRGVQLGDVNASVHYAARPGELRADVRVDPPSIDRLTVQAKGVLPAGAAIEDGLRRGEYELDVKGLVSDVAVFEPLAPDVVGRMQGGLDLQAAVRGSLQGVEGQLEARASRMGLDDMGPASFQARLNLKKDHTQLAATLTDDDGTLAETTVDVDAGAHVLRTQSWRGLGWRLQLNLPKRRLDRLPAPARVDLPVRVFGTLDASGTGPLLSKAKLDMKGDWEGDPLLEAEEGEACAALKPSLAVDAHLDAGQLKAKAKLSVQHEQMLRVEAKGALPNVPLDAWQPGEASLDISGEATKLDLSGMPGNCGRAHGVLDGQFQVHKLLSGAPRLQFTGHVKGLSATEGPAVDMSVEATAVHDGVKLQLRAKEGKRSVMDLRGELPWRWSGLAVPRDLGVPTVKLTLQGLPLAPLAALFPSYGRARGRLDGKLAIRAAEPEWQVDGRLQLRNVYIALADPTLRLEGMKGEVTVSNRALRFNDLRWGDREGRLRTSGEVTLKALRPQHADLMLKASDLPLRSDGIAFATIDTKTRVTADFTKKPAHVHLDIHDLTVRLPDDLTRSTQDLARHPDVIYEDAYEGDQPAETNEPAQSARLMARVTLETQKPFWVRHEDFAVQLDPKLEVVTDQKGVRISGPLVVQRGYVTLVGRSFTFQRGELRFDGSTHLDPTIDLKARHNLGSGDYVEVRIGGVLTAPKLSFHTNVAGVGDNETAIMALLVRGNRTDASTSAEAEAAALLTGITAGFLSSLTRGKYGDYIPVLALEAGSGTGTRVRAGIQMDDFIPKRLRSVVQGAYVEGYLGTGETTASSSSTSSSSGQRTGTSGFLIELYFPHDLVTSSAWDEPNNWSLDLLWEPLR